MRVPAIIAATIVVLLTASAPASNSACDHATTDRQTSGLKSPQSRLS